MIKTCSRISLAGVLLAMFALLPVPASAVPIPSEPAGDRFYFAGNAGAWGWMTLPTGYLLGTALSPSTVLWFEFDSPPGSVAPDTGFHVGAAIGAIDVYPGMNEVQVNLSTIGPQTCTDNSGTCGSRRYSFQTSASGTWSLQSFDGTTFSASGANLVWGVPEPGTIALLGLAIFGVGLAGRPRPRDGSRA